MSALFIVRTVYLERLFSVCIFKTVEWVYIVQRVWFFESVYCLEHALYVFFCSYILTVHIFWYFNVGVRDNPAASLYGLATVGVCNSTITTGGEAAVFPRVSPRLCGKMARNVAPLSYLQVGRWAAWCQRRRSVSTLAECCWIKSGKCTCCRLYCSSCGFPDYLFINCRPGGIHYSRNSFQPKTWTPQTPKRAQHARWRVTQESDKTDSCTKRTEPPVFEKNIFAQLPKNWNEFNFLFFFHEMSLFNFRKIEVMTQGRKEGKEAVGSLWWWGINCCMIRLFSVCVAFPPLFCSPLTTMTQTGRGQRGKREANWQWW